MKKVILASASPRRKEILNRFIDNFEIKTSDVEEVFDESFDIITNLMMIAKKKGSDILKKHQDSIVISADTVVVLNKEILQKPKDRSEAKTFLENLSGTWHKVITSFCIQSNNNLSVIDYEQTLIKFYDLSDDTIEKYLDSNEWVDKAGGYGIQGTGGLLVEKICGDYNNVVGLPISKISQYLKIYFDIDLMGGVVCIRLG